MPLLDFVVGQARAWGIDDVWVVLGHDAEVILQDCRLAGATVLINEDHRQGLASSLSVGLDAMTRGSKADATFILLGDQPTVDGSVVAALRTRYQTNRAPAVVPKYRYTWSNPVLVDRALWPRLMSLEGDQGAQKLLKSHPEWVEEVWFEQLPPRDIDTPADLDELRPRSSA